MHMLPEIARSLRVSDRAEANVHTDVVELALQHEIEALRSGRDDVLHGPQKLDVDIREQEALSLLYSLQGILDLLGLVQVGWHTASGPALHDPQVLQKVFSDVKLVFVR